MIFDRKFRSSNQVHLNIPVISVGNISVGGTGKTPLLIRLARDLIKKDIHPAILTRGYRGFLSRGSHSQIVLGGEKLSSNEMNDEVLLMAQKLPGVPIGVGSNRVESAHVLSNKLKPDVYLLDDGFQHWSLHRDLDIVCLDVTDPWGKEKLLPFGRLREPVSSLGRASLIILTRTELVSAEELNRIEGDLSKQFPGVPQIRTVFELVLWHPFTNTIVSLNHLTGKNILAVSAIGKPEAFELALTKMGGTVYPVRFQDHYRYSAKSLKSLEALSKKKEALFVTTEKDWVKLREASEHLPSSLQASIYVLKIEAHFGLEDERRWMAMLETIFQLKEKKASK